MNRILNFVIVQLIIIIFFSLAANASLEGCIQNCTPERCQDPVVKGECLSECDRWEGEPFYMGCKAVVPTSQTTHQLQSAPIAQAFVDGRILITDVNKVVLADATATELDIQGEALRTAVAEVIASWGTLLELRGVTGTRTALVPETLDLTGIEIDWSRADLEYVVDGGGSITHPGQGVLTIDTVKAAIDQAIVAWNADLTNAGKEITKVKITETKGTNKDVTALTYDLDAANIETKAVAQAFVDGRILITDVNKVVLADATATELDIPAGALRIAVADVIASWGTLIELRGVTGTRIALVPDTLVLTGIEIDWSKADLEYVVDTGSITHPDQGALTIEAGVKTTIEQAIVGWNADPTNAGQEITKVKITETKGTNKDVTALTYDLDAANIETKAVAQAFVDGRILITDVNKVVLADATATELDIPAGALRIAVAEVIASWGTLLELRGVTGTRTALVPETLDLTGIEIDWSRADLEYVVDGGGSITHPGQGVLTIDTVKAAIDQAIVAWNADLTNAGKEITKVKITETKGTNKDVTALTYDLDAVNVETKRVFTGVFGTGKILNNNRANVVLGVNKYQIDNTIPVIARLRELESKYGGNVALVGVKGDKSGNTHVINLDLGDKWEITNVTIKVSRSRMVAPINSEVSFYAEGRTVPLVLNDSGGFVSLEEAKIRIDRTGGRLAQLYITEIRGVKITGSGENVTDIEYDTTGPNVDRINLN